MLSLCLHVFFKLASWQPHGNKQGGFLLVISCDSWLASISFLLHSMLGDIRFFFFSDEMQPYNENSNHSDRETTQPSATIQENVFLIHVNNIIQTQMKL